MSGRALLALLAALVGCYQYAPRTLPAPSSPVPQPAAEPGGLLAGFGRADITAAPGAGLFGYGPEGRQARGYRLRLYARALVLQDSAGERIAIVVADLGAISPLLHRLVADRVVGETGIGADRLLLAATHTHSAPSHFLGAKLYNDHSASVAGFDSLLVEFLVTRIAEAVRNAADSLRPARAAWGIASVWGHTRNRSYGAFTLNDPTPDLPTPPAELQLDERCSAVDPRWAMLRVDLLDATSGDYVPAGALSIFAVHGTANASANDLLDGDVHALVERGLERHIDTLNRRALGFRPHAVHLMANGTAGDVSADWPADTRCGAYSLRPIARPAGPHTPPEPEGWQPPPRDSVAACLEAVRTYMEGWGSSVSARAISLFNRLGTELRDDLRLARAFRTVALKGESAPEGLCREPKLGSATLVGSEDGNTRYNDWRFLGLVPIVFEEGNSAVKESNRGCQGPKRIALFPFHDLAAGPHGFPEVAQFMVVRIGSMLVGAVPAEVTTTAGVRMKEAMLSEAGGQKVTMDSVALITLANGHLQYVTTREEYAAQHYEGASTLYGPGTAEVFQDQLVSLVRELSDASVHPRGISVGPITVYPGKHRSIIPPASAGPPLERIDRVVEELGCRGDTLIVRWLDAYPGRLIPADGPLLRIEREAEAGRWETAVWDDDPHLEVRALRPRARRGYLWEARWRMPAGAAGLHRVALVARQGLPALTGDAFRACQGGPPRRP